MIFLSIKLDYLSIYSRIFSITKNITWYSLSGVSQKNNFQNISFFTYTSYEV